MVPIRLEFSRKWRIPDLMYLTFCGILDIVIMYCLALMRLAADGLAGRRDEVLAAVSNIAKTTKESNGGVRPINKTTLLLSIDKVLSKIVEKYSKEDILDIVNQSHSLNQLSQSLDCQYDCRALRVLVENFDLDIRHFKRFKVEMPDEYIIEICSLSFSYLEMGKWLGYDPTGAFAGAKKHVNRLHLDISHFHHKPKDDKNSANMINRHRWDPALVDAMLELLCNKALSSGDWLYSNGIQQRPVFIYPADVADDPDYRVIIETYRNARIRFKTQDERAAYGYIYLITNKIDGLQYIGQTTKTVEHRWQKHISSGASNPGASRIDDAIQLYGIECFVIETIDHCYCLDELNDKEIYWISKYDCCAQDGEEKGYNWERGGGHCPDIIIDDEKEVCQMYLLGSSMVTIAHAFGFKGSDPIKRILEKQNVKIRTQTELTEWKRDQAGQTVYMYDDSHTLLKTFGSQMEAGEWCFEQGMTNASSARNARYTIRRAILTGSFTYNAYWEVTGWEESEQEKAKESLKRQQSKGITKKKEQRQEDLSRYQAGQSAQYLSVSSISPKQKVCPICGIPITAKANHCRKHSYTELAKAKRRKNWPSKDQLLELAIGTQCNLTAIGRALSISSNQVSKMLAAYALPSHADELKDYLIDSGKIVDPVLELQLDSKAIVSMLLSGYKIETVQKAFHCSKFALWRCCKAEGLDRNDYEQFKENLIQNTVIPIAVDQLTLNGDYVKTFSSAEAAAHSCNAIKGGTHINAVCNGKRYSAYGWKWRWHRETESGAPRATQTPN